MRSPRHFSAATRWPGSTETRTSRSAFGSRLCMPQQSPARNLIQKKTTKKNNYEISLFFLVEIVQKEQIIPHAVVPGSPFVHMPGERIDMVKIIPTLSANETRRRNLLLRRLFELTQLPEAVNDDTEHNVQQHDDDHNVETQVVHVSEECWHRVVVLSLTIRVARGRFEAGVCTKSVK